MTYSLQANKYLLIVSQSIDLKRSDENRECIFPSIVFSILALFMI